MLMPPTRNPTNFIFLAEIKNFRRGNPPRDSAGLKFYSAAVPPRFPGRIPRRIGRKLPPRKKTEKTSRPAIRPLAESRECPAADFFAKGPRLRDYSAAETIFAQSRGLYFFCPLTPENHNPKTITLFPSPESRRCLKLNHNPNRPSPKPKEQLKFVL